MRTSRVLFQRLPKLQDKYQLVEYHTIPDPSIVSDNTFCECEFPKDKPINHEKPLYGTKAIQWKHVLVHSDVKSTEWLSKVELMPTEIISTMNKFKRTVTDPMYPVMISNINLDEPRYPINDNEHRILVYPENKYFNIDEANVENFMKENLNPNFKNSFKSNPNLNRIILICGHLNRDIRCGIIAPILKSEFEYNLNEKGLLYSQENPDGVKVGIVSHIGGHAYAGNVLYFDNDGLNIWYGRVENKHVDAIINETILNKRIIKELYRGRY